MKSIVILILCPSLVLEGCYSYFAFHGAASTQEQPANGERIQITLIDGSVFESSPNHHIVVTEPSDFVYGIGEIIDRTNHKREFSASFQPIAIDSCDVDTTISKGWNSRQRYLLPYYVFSLPEGLTVRCRRSDCIFVTSTQGVGLWCADESSGRPTSFSRRIPFDHIKGIEVRRISGIKTTLFIVTCLTAAVALTLLTTFITPGFDLRLGKL